MAKHFNGLTPAEAERLALVAEECGEVLHAIGKILRHGYESHNPDDDNGSNREMLTQEIGDLDYAIGLLYRSGDVDCLSVGTFCKIKAESVKPYLHHQGA